MMGIKKKADRTQIEMLSIEDLVPKNHLVRKLDAAINLDFIYDEVRDLYKPYGRESIDPVVLIKIVMIQYLFGIRSMRQTLKEIEVNFAYRWYLGYNMHEQLPHFSTFSKNYSRRFKDSDLFETIFAKILCEVNKYGFIDEENIFIDGTHIKANANTHKYRNEVIEESARVYEKSLKEEINNNYKDTESISIDYGILEKSQDIYVIPSDIGWDDVGSWEAIERYKDKDSKGNIHMGNIKTLNGSQNLAISTSSKIIIDGLSDIYVIENDGKIIIGKKENVNKVKELQKLVYF